MAKYIKVDNDHISIFYRKAADAADTFDSEVVAADNDVWLKTCHLEYLKDKLGASE